MSDKLKEYIDQYLDKHIFIKTRTIRLFGDIDEERRDILDTGLEAFNTSSGPIIIKLESDGGSVAIAKTMFDLIRQSPNHVKIVCYGEVSSAATLILQAADQRVMSHNSKLMLHAGSESIPQDHPRNVDVAYNEHRKEEDWMVNVYHKKIKEKRKRFTRQQVVSMLKWDKYIRPKEALDFGLIDEIWENK